MKKLTLIFISALLILSTVKTISAQTGWQVQYTTGNSEWYYDIFFLNENTGWTIDTDGQGKLLKTTNRGVNWISIPNSIGDKTGISFYDEMTGWLCGSSGQLFKTTNGGVNWIFAPNCNCNSSQDDFISIQFINQKTGWVFGDTRVHKTTDGGINYSAVSPFLYVWNGMFIDSLKGWVVGTGGMAYTTDGGENWTRSYLPDSSSSYCIYFINESTGWCQGSINKIYKSTNGGVSWNEQQTNLSSNVGILKIQFVDANTGWGIGTSGTVIKTTNGGENWFRQSTVFQYNVQGIHMLNSMEGWICGRGYILHTTDGGGPAVGISPISNEIPDKFLLSQNYPNPFNPTTKIKFDLPKNSFAKLVIYDAIGKEIETLTNEYLSAGIYETEWNAGNYPSGVYYFRLSTGEYTAVKKMILMK